MLALKVMFVEGLLLFLLAVTIILSLIPLYLKTKTIDQQLVKQVKTLAFNDNATIYLHYQAPADNYSSTTGTIENLNEVEAHLNKALRLDGILAVESGQVQAGLSRRRRRNAYTLNNGRLRSETTINQGLITSILLRCHIKPNARCSTGTCANGASQKVNRAIQRYPDLPDIPLRVKNTQTGSIDYKYSAKFVELGTQVPVEFAGESTTLSFVAIQSGSFNQPSTWTDNIVPYGACHVTIPSGITVTLSRSALELNVRQFNINGTLVLGSSKHSTFTFHYATNMIVHAGGIIRDETVQHKIYLAHQTQWNIHSGATIIGSETFIHSYSSLPAASHVTSQTHIGNQISGPYTCGVLPDGNIETFSKITLIAVQSGDFLQSETWLTGIVPTEEYQQTTGDLGLYVAPKCTLSTASLNGVMNIRFSFINIAHQAHVELGTTQQTNFIFNYPTNIIVQTGGIIRDLTIKQEIYYPVGSVILIHQGGTFVGTNTVVYSYTSLPAIANKVSNFSIGSQTSGPFTCGFMPQGTIQTFNQVTVMAVRTGDIHQETIWLGNLAPTVTLISRAETLGLYIAPDCHLSTTSLNGIMHIKFDLITVAERAVFELGSSTTNTFTFNYATNIIVHQNAIIQDLTIEHKIYHTTNTIITIHQGGSFVGTNTIFYSYNKVSTSINVIANYSSTSTIQGPFTCGIMPSGVIQTFNHVTVIAVQSGEFHQTQVWLGGIVPTVQVINHIQRVELFVAGGCQLSTTHLNGRLDIRFETVTVSQGAVLLLGSSTTKTFTFVHATSVVVQSGGVVEVVTIDHEVIFNVNTVVMVHSGGSFRGSNTVRSVSSLVKVETNINGPFTCGVLPSGVIETFNKVTYMVVQSGEFTQMEIWLGNLMPTVEMSTTVTDIGLYIAPQCHLSTASFNGVMNIKFDVITIADGAVLELGSSTTNSFTFNYATNIIIRQNAIIKDLTIEHKIYYVANSIIMIHQAGTIVGINTVFYSYTKVSSSINVIANYSFTSTINGPFTCGIMPSGKIETFNQVTYIAIRSGEYTQAETWLGNVVPYINTAISNVGFGLYVETGCQLRVSNVQSTQIALFKSITVVNNAVLVLTTTVKQTFTFERSVNIVVMSGGTIRDETVNHQIYFAVNSSVTIHDGGSFVGSNTIIYSHSSSFNYTITSTQSGPFTCGIMSTGVIEVFHQITYIAVQSGDLLQKTTWINEMVPTVGKAIGLYVAPGCHLTTSGLQGVMNIQFTHIIVAEKAILELGTTTVADFTFNYATSIVVRAGGMVRDVTLNHQIYFTYNSLLIVHEQASFVASNTMIYTYDTLTQKKIITSNLTITSEQKGPFTCAVFPEGSIRTFNQVTFIAVQSGDFALSTTWLASYTPTIEITNVINHISLYVSTGCHLVTTSLNGALNTRFEVITIAEKAVFEITSTTTTSFTFNYATHILVEQGAVFRVQTNTQQIYLAQNTLITVYQGGSFEASNTVIYTYSMQPAIINVVANYSISTNIQGPFTCAVFSTGVIQTFDQVTFIAIQSGEFSQTTTWLHQFIPTVEITNVAGNIGVYIAEECHLSTTSLNGIMHIKFDLITVAERAVFELGSSTTNTFTFNYATNIIVHQNAIIQDLTIEHKIYHTTNTIITIHQGGSFVGTNTIFYSYNKVSTSINVIANYSFTSTIQGPFTCGIMPSGVIQTFNHVTLIAVQSGEFHQSQVWLGGIVPTVQVINHIQRVELFVAGGCQLSTTQLNGRLDIRFETVRVSQGAVLLLGSSTTKTFTFVHATSVVVQSGGVVEVVTIDHEVIFNVKTVVMVHSGGSFRGSNTVRSVSSLVKVETNINGPFTCGILSTGTIQTFNELTYIVVQSGEISQTEIWLGYLVPTVGVSSKLYISEGCHVTTTSLQGSLNFEFTSIIIAKQAVFELTSSTFTFNYATNIVVEQGAVFRVQTNTQQIYLAQNTLITVYQGGSFEASNTVIYTYSMQPAIINVVANYSISTNIQGPFTCAVFSTGVIQTFDQVTFIAIQSGEFSQSSTWLCGFTPTTEITTVAGRVGVYIAPQCHVTTTSLNGVMSMKIDVITITEQAVFELGSVTTNTFTFNYATSIVVHQNAIVKDVTIEHKIYYAVNSIIMIHQGASFVGSNTIIYTFTSLPAITNVAANFSMGTNLSGPFTCGLMPSGTIKTFSEVTYIAIQSGEFNQVETWLTGLVPSTTITVNTSVAHVYVESGCQLSTVHLVGSFHYQIKSITVAAGALLRLGSETSASFRFTYSTSIVVLPHGKVVDETRDHQIYFYQSSTFIIHQDGWFNGNQTMIYSWTQTTERQRNLTYTIGSQMTGPFTCGVMPNGLIETFTKITYIVAGVGDFLQTTTWLGDIKPTVEISLLAGGIDIYIPSECQLTTSGLSGVLNIQVNSITVAPQGSLVLGDHTVADFSFQYATNLVILPRATCIDKTINHQIYFISNSVINVHVDASFAAQGTTLFSYTNLPATLNVVSTIALNTSATGPWTCGILQGGVIKTFNKITYITYQSGSFLQSTTWLGGIAPTSDTAQVSNGIDIYVTSGCNLSTDDLNGSLDIQINSVTVSEKSIFQLGGMNVNTFTFYFPVNIVILHGGIIQDRTISNQIYLGFDSMLTVEEGGSFIGTNTILHRYYALPPETNVAANFTVIENSTSSFSFSESTSQISTLSAQRQIVAAMSGFFNETSTWSNGLVPTAEQSILAGGFDLLIASYCNLTIASPDDLSDLWIKTITVTTGGHLRLGVEDFDSFSFNSSISIIVYTGGSIEVQTRNRELFLPLHSQIILYPGGIFIGDNTTIYPQNDSFIDLNDIHHDTIEYQYVGPLSIAAISSGEIQLMPFITYFAVQSGDFFSSETWLGGLVPNADLSVLTGGINLYISEGKTLSISGVYGYLKHQINTIEISKGARCRLGTPLISRGFIFRYPVVINIRGLLEDFTHESTGLYFPPGSSFFVHLKGTIRTKGPTYIYSYFYHPRILLAAATLGDAEEIDVVGRQEISITDSGIYSS